MITCFIRYESDPHGTAAFAGYARNWGQAIPRRGADLVGDFTPHEGSSTTAYGVHDVESPAACEAHRARLRDDPLGRENHAMAERARFIRREERVFPRRVPTPHAVLVRP